MNGIHIYPRSKGDLDGRAVTDGLTHEVLTGLGFERRLAWAHTAADDFSTVVYFVAYTRPALRVGLDGVRGVLEECGRRVVFWSERFSVLDWLDHGAAGVAVSDVHVVLGEGMGRDWALVR